MGTISNQQIRQIIADQQKEQVLPKHYYPRHAQSKLLDLAQSKEIVVIMGLRRCGKSVLLQTIRQQLPQQDYYFNFEDDRLANFTSDDFQQLYELFIELFGEQNTFYFDEIQNIPGWEVFVRRLYNANNKIFITGSNATLFSEELGTRLTGRYLSLRLYPFSFHEYVQYNQSDLVNTTLSTSTNVGLIKQLFSNYCQVGGIPEYTKHQRIDYLHSLYEGILYRDIVARYRISSVDTFKKLVFFLASNCSKETTYSALRKLLGLGSTTTIADYCSYLANSHLCHFINRYSDSVKVQQQSPKKVYFVDHVLAKTIGFRISEDVGRMLENIVFMELTRRNHNIYYHKGDKECDFVIQEQFRVTQAIQVCQDLTDPTTRQREIAGLMDALTTYSLAMGLILTESEEFTEEITLEDKHYIIEVLPIWKWLLNVPNASDSIAT